MLDDRKKASTTAALGHVTREMTVRPLSSRNLPSLLILLSIFVCLGDLFLRPINFLDKLKNVNNSVMLTRFSIIVAIDAANGIARDGVIPWTSTSDLKFFRDTTMGKRKNAVIMGRLTYQSIPDEYRPLEGRHCVVVSRTWKQSEHPDVSVYPSLIDALSGVCQGAYEEVFIAGGESIYNEVVRNYLYLCKRVYITKFKNEYSCDQFFPTDSIKEFPLLQEPTKTKDFTRAVFLPDAVHEESKYLKLLQQVKEEGASFHKIGAKILFGELMILDVSERIPLLTTRRMDYDPIIATLVKSLTRSVADKTVLDLNKVVDKIRSDAILTVISMVYDSKKILFFPSEDRKVLDLMVFIDEIEAFTELADSIALFSILLTMICYVTNLKPRFVKLSIGALKLLHTTLDCVSKQLHRTPRPLPKLNFREKSRLHNLEDFVSTSFVFENYVPATAISTKN